MGDIPIPDALTPAQWLRARTHRYYFWAFAMICFVAIVLFAVASFVASGARNAVPPTRAWKDWIVDRARLIARTKGYLLYKEFALSSNFDDPDATWIAAFTTQESKNKVAAGILLLKPAEF